MRELAGRLGVSATALYWHFPDRETLLDGVAKRVIKLSDATPPRALSWRERVAFRLNAVRRSLLQHPNAFPLFNEPRRLALSLTPIHAKLAADMLAGGIEGALLARSLQVLFIHTLGSVFTQTSVIRALAQTSNPTAVVDSILTNPEVAPSIESIRPYLGKLDYKEIFASTTTLLLADIEARRKSGDR